MNKIKGKIYFSVPQIIFILLSLFHLDNFCINGDEWYSIECAQNLGRSFMALPYFLILKLILFCFAINEFILRLASIFFGMLTVTVLYFIGKELKDIKLGFILSFLSAISPFLIAPSQAIRYYSFFALFSSISMFSFFLYLRHYNKKFLYIFLVTNIFGFFMHFNITFLFLGEMLYILYFNNRKDFWYFCFTLSFFVIFIYFISFYGINALSVIYKFGYTKNIFTNLQPKGIRISSIIKPIFTIYFIIFGPNVSPYKCFLTIPTIFFFLMLFIKGVRSKILKEKPFLNYAFFLFFIPLFLFYITAEPLSPLQATGVEPKHAMFVFPVWIITVGLGLYSIKRSWYKNIFWGVLLIANIFILKEYYYPVYSYYGGSYINFRKSAKILRNSNLENILFITDGRAKKSFEFYNSGLFNKRHSSVDLWTFNNYSIRDLEGYRKIVLVCNDYRAYGGINNIDEIYSKSLLKINENFFLKEGYVEYPFFFYIFTNKEYADTKETNTVFFPTEFYGFEYADLKLPIKVYGREILHSFLIKENKMLSLQIDEQILNNDGSLILINNLEGTGDIKNNSAIGEISIFYKDETANQISLIKGLNVFDVSADFFREKINNDSIAYSWIKYPLITSKQFYRGVWAQYRAYFYALIIPLENKKIKNIIINYTHHFGELRIWSIFITPQTFS